MFRQAKPHRTGNRVEALPEPHDGLPDSSRQSGLCPRCGKQSSFQVLGSLPVTYDGTVFVANPDGSREQVVLDQVTSLMCRHCNQGVAVVEEKWVGDHPAHEKAGGGTVHYRGIHWWPLPEIQISSDIPAEIVGAFAEAMSALHANCPRASAVMARRTLEAITVDKGETQGVLYGRLRNLVTRGVLQPALADWAHEVRLVGNTGAHFDPINQVSMDDARDLVTFIRELLRYLYELPADLTRRRSSRP